VDVFENPQRQDGFGQGCPIPPMPRDMESRSRASVRSDQSRHLEEVDDDGLSVTGHGQINRGAGMTRAPVTLELTGNFDDYDHAVALLPKRQSVLGSRLDSFESAAEDDGGEEEYFVSVPAPSTIHMQPIAIRGARGRSLRRHVLDCPKNPQMMVSPFVQGRQPVRHAPSIADIQSPRSSRDGVADEIGSTMMHMQELPQPLVVGIGSEVEEPDLAGCGVAEQGPDRSSSLDSSRSQSSKKCREQTAVAPESDLEYQPHEELYLEYLFRKRLRATPDVCY